MSFKVAFGQLSDLRGNLDNNWHNSFFPPPYYYFIHFFFSFFFPSGSKGITGSYVTLVLRILYFVAE